MLLMFYIHPKGTFKDSDKELDPFPTLRSVMFLKQNDFFLHFVI